MEKQIAERILSLASSARADAAEVFLRSHISTSIEVKGQKVDAFDHAHDIGAGLRVLVRGHLGFAFTTDISESALKTLAESAYTNALNTEPELHHSIPVKTEHYPSPALYDPELASLSEKEKIERVMSLERAAFAVDQRVKRIRKASAVFASSETLIMNTNGVLAEFKGTAASSGIEVVAEDNGESQAGSDYDVKRFYRKLEVEEVGRRAARRALALLGAKSIGSVKAPVVLDTVVAEEFLAMMASGFSAENVQKKKSLFMDKLNSLVASPLVTVYDDGLLEGGMGSAPCDDEGVPMRKKTVIDKGRLALYLYNTYTANKDKTTSTGNGMRGGFKGLPGVGITNLYVEPGSHSLDQLIQAANRGLYVTEVMGMHTANPISGDFSVGATGFWIENGVKAFPVREITIAGNILDMMQNVDMIGSDLRFSGRIGCPSIRIKELSIAGK